MCRTEQDVSVIYTDYRASFPSYFTYMARRYMTEILPIRRKNNSINQSINQTYVSNTAAAGEEMFLSVSSYLDIMIF